MAAPGTVAAHTENQSPPPGDADEDRFAGYGVMGLPFRSGHVLAVRHFPASSIGPGYTSVWHRSPDGDWTFWQNQPDHQSCPHYFSGALARSERADIDLHWPTPDTLRVRVPAAELDWTVTMTASAVTRAMNTIGSVLPDRAWRAAPVLHLMSRVAGKALGAGTIGLTGTAPNGHHFVATPRKIWIIADTSARLGSTDLGDQGPLSHQAHLGDFWIPQRGVFAVGSAYFTNNNNNNTPVKTRGEESR